MERFESLKSLRFLVTDDYESMRMIVQEELELLGVNLITFAKSGNEALEILEKRSIASDPINFVITDMMMDNGSGLDLTTQMRMSEKFKNTPILMISSMAEATFILKCIQAGIDDYIVKPWESEDLVKKIYQICQKRGLV